MASTQPAHRPKGERVTPVHTLELVKALGTTRAATALGVSTSLLHAARRQRKVSRVVEIAAEGRLHSPVSDTDTRQTAANGNTPHVLLLLEIPVERRAIVEQFAKAIGAEFLADAVAA